MEVSYLNILMIIQKSVLIIYLSFCLYQIFPFFVKIGSRGAPVIIGTSTSGTARPMVTVPAPYVPEELVSQAQVVLQGKSRNLIIRELQVRLSYVFLDEPVVKYYIFLNVSRIQTK